MKEHHEGKDELADVVEVLGRHRVAQQALAAEPHQGQRHQRHGTEEAAGEEEAAAKKALDRTAWLLAVGGVLCLLVGLAAPASFMQHFIVFVLAVFVGFYVIWGVAHALHTPLMAITNAISSIIIVGALLQIGSGTTVVMVLAALSILMASVNIFGGFLVTRRMLAMFERS